MTDIRNSYCFIPNMRSKFWGERGSEKLTRTSRCFAYLWLLLKDRSLHRWQDFSAFGSKATLEKRRGQIPLLSGSLHGRSGRKNFSGKGRKTFERQNSYKRLIGEWGTPSHSQSPRPYILESFGIPSSSPSWLPIVNHSQIFGVFFCGPWPGSPLPVSPHSVTMPDEAQHTYSPTPVAQELPAYRIAP